MVTDAPTEAERLEALSHCYVDAARVVALASGRYAVFAMARGDLFAIASAEELGNAVAEACRRSGSAWAELRQLEARERREEPPVPLGTTADAIGL